MDGDEELANTNPERVERTTDPAEVPDEDMDMTEERPSLSFVALLFCPCGTNLLLLISGEREHNKLRCGNLNYLVCRMGANLSSRDFLSIPIQ